MANELDELRTMYPVFVFKNKTASPQEIALYDDSVLVQARGTVKLRSSLFINLPPTDTFTFIKPTLDDLRAVGLLATREVKTEVKPSPKGNSGSTDGAE